MSPYPRVILNLVGDNVENFLAKHVLGLQKQYEFFVVKRMYPDAILQFNEA